jgi:hypothetical protein
LITGYKLLRRRKDGSLGSLFINKGQRLPVGKWLEAELYPTKGYAFRQGWHALTKMEAPHLKIGPGRVWMRVRLKGVRRHVRPVCQGGEWLVARHMYIEGLAE